MILLTPVGEPRARPPLVALFGHGLIGQGIVSALCHRAPFLLEELPFSWQDPEARAHHGQIIAQRLAALRSGERPLALVWSAGRCGFAATEAETDYERQIFDQILGVVAHLRSIGVLIHFHLISSAGGLFEGQRAVGPGSVPQPHRPYGRLKQDQEVALAALAGIERDVYRPSSVYGPIQRGVRMGLVPTLVLNGLQRRKTTIVGNLSTLRDYVWRDDVGDYVAASIVERSNDQTCRHHLLVAGRPSSIHQIVHLVETAIRHRPYVSLRHQPSNEWDITFGPAGLPPSWRPIDLETGVHRVVERWQQLGPAPRGVGH